MIDFEGRTPLERDVKRRVVGIYRRLGVEVDNLDQGFRPGGGRHGTTRQSKGISDLICWHPRIGVWFHEVKRDGGVLSWEQQQWQARCERCRQRYVLGGPHEALAFLMEHGLYRLPAGTTLVMVASPTRVTRETEAQHLTRIQRRRRGCRPTAVQTSGIGGIG